MGRQPAGEDDAAAVATAMAEPLRSATARASELAGGAPTLLFTGATGFAAGESAPTLRAAAGVPSAAAARDLAAAMSTRVAESMALWSGDDEVLGSPGTGPWISPLACAERVHGALVVDVATALPPESQRALQQLAADVGLRLDHAHLADRLRRIEDEAQDRHEEVEEKSEELLKLSEALFAQDIEILRKDERLGTVERLKNDFIEKMSRELRTPLNSIIEAIISVLAGENESLSDGAKASLRRALDDGSSFLRTLQNILDLWRIKQGELPVELQEVNFREVVEEAIFSVQDGLGDKPVVIEKRIAEPLPKLRTDLAKVNQIVFLLLENAVKFTRRGNVTIELGVAEGRLECALRDTGIGICPDDRQFIFDEFYQVDDGELEGYRGSGLGLALVRDLVALLGGEIEVESEVGQGSTFRFRIPVEVLS